MKYSQESQRRPVLTTLSRCSDPAEDSSTGGVQTQHFQAPAPGVDDVARGELGDCDRRRLDDRLLGAGRVHEYTFSGKAVAGQKTDQPQEPQRLVLRRRRLGQPQDLA